MNDRSVSLVLLLGFLGCLHQACSSPAESDNSNGATESGTAPNTSAGTTTTGTGASATTGIMSTASGSVVSTSAGVSTTGAGVSTTTGGASGSVGTALTTAASSSTTGTGTASSQGGAGGSGGAASTTGEGGSGAAGGSGGTGGLVGNPSRVLLCDEGNRRVVLLDLDSPSPTVWSTPINDANAHGDGLRDLQLVGGNRAAASTAKGYVELDIDTGEITKEVSNFSGVESMRRLPNGNTVLGSNATGGVMLQELDAEDSPGRSVTFPSLGQFRMLRRTPDDTFLLGVGHKLAEVNWQGDTVWEMDIPDGDYVYQGLRLADNTIAVTSGYGASIQIIDPAAKSVVRSIGGKGQPDAASIVPNFFAGFQVLANGHFVVTNWEGHGAGNGGTGIQLLEYDTSGVLVWKWEQDPALVSSLHHVIVLDGLDTNQLHDDINGVLAPVTQ